MISGKTRFLSGICAISILMSQGALTVSAVDRNDENPVSAAEQMEENSKIHITLDCEQSTLLSYLKDNITIQDKVYDGTLDLREYSHTLELKGIQDSDEVYIEKMDIQFADKNAGVNKKVTVKSITLGGTDCDKYELTDFKPVSFESNAKIEQKELTIIPKEEKKYSLSEVNKDLGSDCYDIEGIIDGDTVEVDLTLKIIEIEGSYEYQWGGTTGNSNYVLMLKDDIKPIVELQSPAIDSSKVIVENNNSISLKDSVIYTSKNIKAKINVENPDLQEGKIKLSVSYGTETWSSGEIDLNQKEYPIEFAIPFTVDEAEIDELKYTFDFNGEETTGTISKFEFNGNPADKLIIDKTPPKIVIDENGNEQIQVSYNYNKDGNYQNVKVTGTVENDLSGIAKIEYRWDYQQGYTDSQTTINSNDGTFAFVYPYDDEFKEKDQHKLYLKITDNAGNFLETNGTYCDNGDGVDTQAPKVTKILLTDEESNTAIDQLLHILTFGNYTNKMLTLEIEAEDRAQSGNKSDRITAKLFDYEIKDGEREIHFVQEQTNSNGKFTFTIPDNFDRTLHNFTLRLSDKYGNTLNKIINDLLNNSDVTANSWLNQEHDDINHGNKWVFDKTLPHIDVIKEKDLYGKDGGEITITVTDDNLSKVTIIGDSSNPSEVNVEKNIGETETSFSYKIDTSRLNTGKYKIHVNAEDYAGNSAEEVAFEFSTDHELPTGDIEVVSHTVKYIDNKNWINEEENENTVPVKIRFTPKNKYGGSQWDKFIFQINGSEQKIIKSPSDLENGYLELELPTNDDVYISENKYVIKAQLWVSSANKSEIEYELYVDKGKPKIGNFIVTKKETSAVEKIINVLTFGIFSNDSVEISVLAQDAEHDVGIDYVQFIYMDEEKNEKVLEVSADEQGNGYYTLSLPSDVQVYQTELIVKAVDKFGKIATGCLNSENIDVNGTNLAENLIMIETVKPKISFTMPHSDYTDNDENRWFKSGSFDEEHPDNNRNISVKMIDVDSGVRNVTAALKITNRDDIELTSDSYNQVFQCSINGNGRVQSENEYKFSIDALSKLADDTDGKYELRIEVVDNAGNVSKESCIFYRDITAPEVTDFKFEQKSENEKENTNKDVKDVSFDENENIVKMDYGYYFKETFDVCITAADTNVSSGFKEATITLVGYNSNTFDKSETVIMTGNESAYIEIPSGFKGMIYASAVDNAGNISGRKTPRAFVTDDEKPVIEIQSLPETEYTADNENNLYKGKVSFRVIIRDSQSGLKEVSYKTSSKKSEYANIEGNLSESVFDNIMNAEIFRRRYSDEDNIIDDGWIVTGTDLNIVTEIQKIFTYEGFDDKEIILDFVVKDNANNESKSEQEPFTIDTTKPMVTGITFSDNTVDEISEIKSDDFIGKNNFEYKYYFQSPFSITTTANDSEPSSGLDTMDFRFVSYKTSVAGKENNDTNENTEENSGTSDEKTDKDTENDTILKEYIVDSQKVSVQEIANELESNGKTTVSPPEEFKKGQIFVKAFDKARNESDEVGIYGIVVDDIAPNIDITPLPQTNDKNNAVDDIGNVLYNDPKNIYFTVTIEDKESGIKNISYFKTSEQIGTDIKTVSTDFENSNSNYTEGSTIGNSGDGSDWTIVEMDHNLVTKVCRTFTFDEATDEKGVIFSFNATNRANVTSENKESVSFTIDTKEPIVTGVSFSKTTEDGINESQNFIEKLEYGYYFKENFDITASFEDSIPSSGLRKALFRFVPYENGIQGESETKVVYEIRNIKVNSSKKIVTGEATCSVKKGFKGQIFITVYDYVADAYNQNMSKEITTQAYIIDDSAPEISISKLMPTNAVDDKDNILYNDPKKVSFKVTITDTISGIRNVNYTKHSEQIAKSAEKTIHTEFDNVNSKYVIHNTVRNSQDGSDWIIEETDQNLVTKISRIFTFDKDEKGIYIDFSATDRSKNISSAESEHFTIDTQKPTITGISFSKKTEDNITKVDTKDFITNLEYGYYFKDSFEITASFEDAVPSSGLKKVVFRFVPYENGRKGTNNLQAIETIQDIVVSKNVINGKAKCMVEKGFKGQIFVTAYDYAANVYNVNLSDEITTQAYVVESDTPVITINPLPITSLTDDLGNKLYTGIVQFEVTITDTKSGLRQISYANSSDNIRNNANAQKEVVQSIENYNKSYHEGYVFENTKWRISKMDKNLVTQVKQTFSFSKDDKNIYMIFNAVDRCNNKSNNNSEKFTIDTTSPIIQRFNFSPPSQDNLNTVNEDDLHKYIEKNIEEFDYGYYFKTSFDATVIANDAIPSSGLDKITFRLVPYNDGKFGTEESHDVTIENQQATYTIPEGFKGQVYAKVYDRAQNQSFEQMPDALVVDEEIPEIQIEELPQTDYSCIDSNQKEQKLYIGQVKFKVTITDTKSGLRRLIYSKQSEKDSYANVTTNIENLTQRKEGDNIGGNSNNGQGWIIEKMDKNLITRVSQVFTFDKDDNDIIMIFNAVDRSNNTYADDKVKKSEPFTIDNTPPEVTIAYPEPKNGMYYKEKVTFTITVVERNFDADRMELNVKNSLHNTNVSKIEYTSNGNNHAATVTLEEGDYTFDYAGTDRGNNKANIHHSIKTENGAIQENSYQSFHKVFNVDNTSPKIEAINFKADDNSIFENKKYYNEKDMKDRHIQVTITEHNVTESSVSHYIRLEIKSAAPGNLNKTIDFGAGYTVYDKWIGIANSKDQYSLDIDMNEKYDNDDYRYPDGVYQIVLSGADPAGNIIETVSSHVFEIDRTAPVLESRTAVDKNGKINSKMGNDDIVYTQTVIEKYDKGLPLPTVKFADHNHSEIIIEGEATIIRNNEQKYSIAAERLDLSSTVESNTYKAEQFTEDGIYNYIYTSFDRAGNNVKEEDCYIRMTENDMLAYVDGFNILMDEEGNPISKNSQNIPDIVVYVYVEKQYASNVKIMFVGSDEKFAYAPEDDSYTASKKKGDAVIEKKITIPSDYFKKEFSMREGEWELVAVVEQGTETKEQPLATVNIDNKSPTLHQGLNDEKQGLKNFSGTFNVRFTDTNADYATVTLEGISEKLDNEATTVKKFPSSSDNEGGEIIHHIYDPKTNTLSFTLPKGVHNIDITLVDEAGNKFKIDRAKNLIVTSVSDCVWLSIGIVILIVGIIVTIVFLNKRKKNSGK